MGDQGLTSWEVLFARAMVLVESARAQGIPVGDWTFGGGTVLMRRHRHRLSKDVDIFINDPQFLGYLSPRLNQVAEDMTRDYVEDHMYLKLAFPEGEIDFVASAPLTQSPAKREPVLGHEVLVETSTEIVAKKIWHRGAQFTARDIFDLSMVAEREPEALHEIQPILRDRRDVVLARIEANDRNLRESFAALTMLDYTRTFDECIAQVRSVLAAAGN